MGVRPAAAAVTLGVVFTACSAAGGGTAVDLDGRWVLVSGRSADGPLEVTPDNHVTVTFDGDGFGGKAPCNDYGGDFERDGSSFEVTSGIEQTLMGCDAEALESAYFSALGAVNTVVRNGDTLTMTGDEVELELSLDEPWPAEAVVGHRWLLVAWTDDAGVEHEPEWEPGFEPFVLLDGGKGGGRITASTGCRSLVGRWQLWHGAPAITESEYTGECPERLMDQEVAVGSALSEPILELRTIDGEPELVLRYAHGNSPSEVVYRR